MSATFSAAKAAPAASTEVPSADGRWQLVQRIAASGEFARSELLRRFLLHICELFLANRTDEIREQQIGVRVFGRPASYNPGDDNIVRNYAVQLRKRLNLYFEREGEREDYRIEIPRGGYVPVFHPRLRAADEPATDLPVVVAKQTENLPEPVQRPAGRGLDWRAFFVGLAIGVVLLLARSTWSKIWQREQPASTHPLWSAIFLRDRDTFIVPADSGLGILQNLTEQPARLADYLNGEYLANVKVNGIDRENVNDLRTQRYTSMADLHITSRLSHLPEVVPDHLIVKYARDLRMDDLKNGNAVLLGAIHTDPWVGLLQSNLNFQFACGKRVDDCYIRNSHPRDNESPTYRFDANLASRETYAIIALLPNLSHTGWILLIEGLDMAGTEAAANLLLDDTATGPFFKRIIANDGALKPFELLVRTGSLGAEALPARIIALRTDE